MYVTFGTFKTPQNTSIVSETNIQMKKQPQILNVSTSGVYNGLFNRGFECPQIGPVGKEIMINDNDF